MGAGKSTLAHRLAAEQRAVLWSEDVCLATLYPGEIRGVPDYQNRSQRVHQLLAQNVVAVLRAGVNVVMDFPGNTPSQRQWLLSLAESASASHVCHWLDAKDEVCLQRVMGRRHQEPERQATDTPEMFALMLRHFVPPADAEGLHVVRHRLA